VRTYLPTHALRLDFLWPDAGAVCGACGPTGGEDARFEQVIDDRGHYRFPLCGLPRRFDEDLVHGLKEHGCGRWYDGSADWLNETVNVGASFTYASRPCGSGKPVPSGLSRWCSGEAFVWCPQYVGENLDLHHEIDNECMLPADGLPNRCTYIHAGDNENTWARLVL
jgi:hypothetical protein